MPTGYTFNVVDGTVADFPTFAMQCARAFGACIEMRDDPADTPIPDEFKASSYHTERLAEARAKLQKLRSMTPAEAEINAALSYEQECKSADEYDARRDEEDRRLDAMLAEVKKWTPPTAEHVQMKSFMVEQLTISKSGNYRASRPKKLSGQDWLEMATDAAMRDVDYHAGEQAKEEERAKARTAWVNALRQSLQPGAAQ